MLDFNHRPTLSEKLTELIDQALVSEQALQKPREYLGASRLGIECNRQLQYEYTHTPKDEGFSGRILRIFEAGHVFEELAINWLRAADIRLITRKSDGSQFGFSAAGGRIQGHVDGIIADAPDALDVFLGLSPSGLSPLGLRPFPMLWECKSLNAKSWKDTVKQGLTKSKPVYAAQIALYQAYMEASVPEISKNPALFTAINKDTAELYFELISFDAALAQKASDRAITILKATEAGELLPRVAQDSTYVECRFCAYRNRCWEGH